MTVFKPISDLFRAQNVTSIFGKSIRLTFWKKLQEVSRLSTIFHHNKYKSSWTFQFGCLTWFRFRVSIYHPLGFNWHPLEGAGWFSSSSPDLQKKKIHNQLLQAPVFPEMMPKKRQSENILVTAMGPNEVTSWRTWYISIEVNGFCCLSNDPKETPPQKRHKI